MSDFYSVAFQFPFFLGMPFHFAVLNVGATVAVAVAVEDAQK